MKDVAKKSRSDEDYDRRRCCFVFPDCISRLSVVCDFREMISLFTSKMQPLSSLYRNPTPEFHRSSCAANTAGMTLTHSEI